MRFPPDPIRVTEVLGALSLTTDLATGAPFEKGLATCLVATALAERAGLTEADRRTVFHAALLGAVGCTSRAPENATAFADDVAFQRALHVADPGDPEVFVGQLARFGAWAPRAQPRLRERFAAIVPDNAAAAVRSVCEVSRALGPRLGLPEAAVVALTEVKERWDGLGAPERLRGEQISLTGRIVHVAEQAVLAAADRGRAGAVAELRRRAGGHLDPDVVALFTADAAAVWDCLDVPDVLATVVHTEPGVPLHVRPGERLRLCLALAIVVDLKGRWLLGHSGHVADLAGTAAELCGMPAEDCETLRAAALLHDIGRAGVSSAIWDHLGPLGPGDWERVRLHTYWTERVLRRCPGLADLADTAAGHHERLDGSGYHRGIRGRDSTRAARILAAADVFAALTESRPHRAAYSPDAAARELLATAGRLDREACAAVVAAAGLQKPRTDLPCGLTEREVEVLRLAARGLSNREIAAELVVSERTVGHHLAHVYDKTGRRTRAGAAVFAMEHGLLPEY
ncbi:HD domain-containing phosphohydrolase [Nocardia blacklockiae]|uniref:HD domain-containing phosphohydrolase n=1 Tax=Nocardia blacklockiae TaxID=480036 RepID=UPI0018959E33|nr:HD domain-containing phosphohydrolase [Nocardia blacklockiae]MBF6170667.1 HD domain-containing protein [Nocardia blacklockiae]